jgi:hypothetical protein
MESLHKEIIKEMNAQESPEQDEEQGAAEITGVEEVHLLRDP